MTALAQHVEDYLAIRRALGFKLRTERRMLADFALFMDTLGQPTVTAAAAVADVRHLVAVMHVDHDDARVRPAADQPVLAVASPVLHGALNVPM